ncbi:predicted protein [Naegleria gruberi]|uniref:Predicted protein n=1 Tax=Naegleria gruberi TaxID=5762 RepID=D2VIV4_NAEGR|nr:uncharacterized protein NAEGRDRAFT_68813 [Naegleria gruberi]EFC43091.1 predicted protein [Naegleria gruberi]|eukprot:XP_002675835.1 predicted protein [Naegleria gruberi strain NEG-M]
MENDETLIEIECDGTITLEHNGQLITINAPTGHQTFKLKIKNNQNKTPKITSSPNVIFNDDDNIIKTIVQSKFKNEKLVKKYGWRCDKEKKVQFFTFTSSQDGKLYVVKVFKKEGFTWERDFIREVSYVINISHPNIVRIYEGDTFTINDVKFNYYKMDYYTHGSLEAWANERTNLNEKSLLMIMLQLVNAVKFIQTRNIIHRDIRPANILIQHINNNDGIPIIALADFEYATKPENSSVKGSICGTPNYDPKIITHGYSFNSDCYSIGRTMFDLIVESTNNDNSLFDDDDNDLNSTIKDDDRPKIEDLLEQNIISETFAKLIFSLLEDSIDLDILCIKLLQLLQKYIKWTEYIKDEYILSIIQSNVYIEFKVVEEDYTNFEYISEQSKNNYEFKKKSVQKNGLVIQYFTNEDKNNIELVKLAFNNNYNSLQFASEEIRKNFKLMQEFSEKEPLCLEYILDVNNIIYKLNMKNLVQKNGLALQYATESDKNNIDIVKLAVKQNPQSLRYSSKDIRENFLPYSLKSIFDIFRNYSNEFTKNKRIVLESIRENVLAFEYADIVFKNDFEFICEAIKYNNKILSYLFKLNDMEDIQNIVDLIDKRTNNLTLNKCPSNELINFLKKMKQLTLLDFIYNIGDEGAKLISEMKQLTSLDISENNIGVEGAKYISEMKQLTSLNICRNEIGVEGVKYISEMKQLTSLDISYNKIGVEGAKYISEMKQLTSLDISENNIGVEGAKYISEMKQLTSLDINYNKIGDEGAKYISKMKQLTSLNIRRNEIGVEGVKYISEMKQLTSLDISYNKIGVEGAKYLSEMKTKTIY